MDNKTVDALLAQIAKALPQGWDELKGDVEHNLHAALRSALTRLDLVTRDEFEIQREVLARTREKYEALAKQVAELEKQLLK